MNWLAGLGGRMLLTAALAGCAAAPVAPPPLPPQLLADAAFAPPARPVDPAEALALSPAMRRYLEVEIASQLRTLGRQRGLAQALQNHAQLRIEYDAQVTRTAAEAFDARAGNCLSLVLMAAALARQLDLPVRYQALAEPAAWSRQGALNLVTGHVNIVIGQRLIDHAPGAGASAGAPLRLEFGAPPPGRQAAMREVGERTIVAMFLNNRAAESLLAGDAAQAYAYARAAVLHDPGYAAGANTLGVIYRRQGLTAQAERAFAHALALAPEDRAALGNQAQLMEALGDHAQAAELRARLARIEAQTPFAHFDRGLEALARGDHAGAREHLLRELRRDPDYHEFHYWLAVALAGLGDTRGAAHHLQRAADNSSTRSDQALYAAKLARLRTQTRVH
jgi:tetratricopeptide (TPR) repeat protein